MRKMNRGFTLVELLAVIVVLAIIMVIATMSVNNSIKKNRTQAFESNMDIAVKNAKRILAIDGKLTTQSLKESLDFDENEYNYEVSGSNPYYLILKSKADGKFKNVDFNTLGIKKENYWYIMDNNGKNVIVAKLDVDGSLANISKIDINSISPLKPDSCNVSNGEISIGLTKINFVSFCNYETGKNEKFYVINFDDDTVTMIANHNLVVDVDNKYYGLQDIDNNINKMEYYINDSGEKNPKFDEYLTKYKEYIDTNFLETSSISMPKKDDFINNKTYNGNEIISYNLCTDNPFGTTASCYTSQLFTSNFYTDTEYERYPNYKSYYLWVFNYDKLSRNIYNMEQGEIQTMDSGFGLRAVIRVNKSELQKYIENH